MPWLLASPGYHHPWYWLCRIAKYLPFLRKGFNYLCYVSVKKWHKFQIYFVLARKGLVKCNPKKYANSLWFVVLRCDLLMVGYIHILQGCYPGQSVQDCCISIANALDILQSCTKPSTWFYKKWASDYVLRPFSDTDYAIITYTLESLTFLT